MIFDYKKQFLYYINIFYNVFLYYFLIIISIILIKYTSNKNAFILQINKCFIDVLSPIHYVIKIPFNFLYESALDIKNIIYYNEMNKELLKENEELKNLYQTIDTLTYENNNLKKFLNYNNSLTNKKKYITTKVYYSIYNTLNIKMILPLGLNDGIKKNDIVLNEKNLVIGRVTDIKENFSQVLLINSLSSNIPARTLNTNEKLILTGYNNNLLKISYYLSSSLNLQEDEIVVTSNDGNVIMDGLVIGKIKKIKNNFYVKIDDIKMDDFVKVLTE